MIRRINSYAAARQILLSHPDNFATVVPDTHGRADGTAVQGLVRNIYPHPRPPHRSNDLHRSVQRSARVDTRESFANGLTYARIVRGNPDQVPVRVEDANSVWPC